MPDNRFSSKKDQKSITGILNPLNWTKLPKTIGKIKKNKGIQVLHFKSEHLVHLIETFKKFKLLALEKEQLISDLADKLALE